MERGAGLLQLSTRFDCFGMFGIGMGPEWGGAILCCSVKTRVPLESGRPGGGAGAGAPGCVSAAGALRLADANAAAGLWQGDWWRGEAVSVLLTQSKYGL